MIYWILILSVLNSEPSYMGLTYPNLTPVYHRHETHVVFESYEGMTRFIDELTDKEPHWSNYQTVKEYEGAKVVAIYKAEKIPFEEVWETDERVTEQREFDKKLRGFKIEGYEDVLTEVDEEREDVSEFSTMASGTITLTL